MDMLRILASCDNRYPETASEEPNKEQDSV
jgi:hypothetical protein